MAKADYYYFLKLYLSTEFLTLCTHVQCTPENGETVKWEFRIKGKVPRERISDYLFLTTLVKGEFRLIRNFLLLLSCPDYPEYTVLYIGGLQCDEVHSAAPRRLHLIRLQSAGQRSRREKRQRGRLGTERGREKACQVLYLVYMYIPHSTMYSTCS